MFVSVQTKNNSVLDYAQGKWNHPYSSRNAVDRNGSYKVEELCRIHEIK